MFSIRQSLADCMTCDLLDAPSCIAETNTPDDISKVDVVVLATNPGKTEVEEERPLCGKAGTKFREYFDKYVKNNFNWLLSNFVLCATISSDGKTENPDKQTVEKCKVNAFDIIKRCNPKLIVVMGSHAKEALGIKGNVTSIRGSFFEWEGYDVLVTVHPSMIIRPYGKYMEPKFEEDIKNIANFLNGNELEENNTTNTGTKKGGGMFYYNISEPKFYSKDYLLIDTQHLPSENKVLYIFKDNKGRKYYHKESDEFVCYQVDDKNKAKKLMPYDELKQIHINYNERFNLDPEVTYEGDVRVDTKHAQDYYLNSKGEPEELQLGILYTDIEVYSTTKDASSPEEANNPVVMITNYFNGQYKVYLLDIHGENLKSKVKFKRDDTVVEIFEDEKLMLQRWISDLKENDPDIISGFYSIPFDMTYLISRAHKFGIDQNEFSKFGDVYLDGFNWICTIPGFVVLDQYNLYRDFTFTKLESYSLENIAQKHLGKGKTGKSFDFSALFNEDIDSAIEYNLVDVELLVELEEALQHIFLLNEIRKICACNFRGSVNQLGRIDSLIITSMKQKGLACKNGDPQSKEQSSSYEGAYVHPPISGVHDYFVDFDFKSLYPSLILTYNIGVNSLIGKLEDPKFGYELTYRPNELPENVNVVIDPVFSAQKTSFTRDELLNKIEKENLISTVSGALYKQHDDELSIYAEIEQSLLDTRDVYKNKMFEELEKGNKTLEALYDTRQNVYKILANAMYGVLGNNTFRFFNTDLARSITLSGQEAIKQSIMKGDEYIEYLKTGKPYSYDIFPFTKSDIFTKDLQYKTPNIITGDTDSIFATFEDLINPDDSMEETISKMEQWCEELQDFLNDHIIAKTVGNHRVDLKWNKLKLKNELVNKRGMFLAKKRYVLYNIKKEGKDVDKIINMGLETKRSDYPNHTKKLLEDLLDIILKESKLSINRINNFVEEKEKEMRRLIKNGDKRAGRPVSFSKKLEDYKKYPEHILGMLNWNTLFYETFGVGSKGYLFKVKGIDPELAPEEILDKYEKYFRSKNKKLTSIVVPEEDELPEYIIVNTEAMVKFAWKDRCKLLLDPIQKNFPDMDEREVDEDLEM